MNKVKQCPDCQKEISKSAKICPHCGKKLKMGLFLKMLIVVVAVTVLAIVFAPTEEEKEQQLLTVLETIDNAQPDALSPSGDLSELFSFNSKNTDIQRDNKKKEINGKIVQWSLPIYEVKKRATNTYRVQTIASSRHVGTFLTLYARDENEVAYIEGLQTDNILSFKGKIIGTTMRYIDIRPAVLVHKK